jgi:Flp pilus assembly protein TadG
VLGRINDIASWAARPVSRLRAERGQTAVEFALVAPALIALVLGIWQFGIIFHNYVTLTDAARAGARKAIVARLDGGSITDAEQAVRNSASDLDQSKLVPDVTVDPSWNQAGSMVTVTASYPYSVDIPFLGIPIASGTLTATAKEQLE